MGLNTELLALELAEGFVTEALDEVSGRSRKSWALFFVSAVVGAYVALIVIRRRRRQIVTAAPGQPIVAPVPT